MTYRYLLLLLLPLLAACSATEDRGLIPVLYSSDLFHPHDDPDDHFDAAVLFSIEELDIKGIILDQGKRGDRGSGKIPVSQLNHLTNRNIPTAVGLAQPLAHINDKGLKDPPKHQNGVRMILQALEESKKPMTIITVGSLRDVAAAFNRKPQLFREKLGRLLVFAGEANHIFVEHNVGLDPHAYTRIMTSDLPVYWVPCFDGGPLVNNGRASYYTAKHADMLAGVGDRILQYFIYALFHKTDEPIAFLSKKPGLLEKSVVFSGVRNFWCTSLFGIAANHVLLKRDDAFISTSKENVQAGDTLLNLFDFENVALEWSEGHLIVREDTSEESTIRRFKITDTARFAEVMTSTTNHRLRSFDSPTKH